MNGTATSEATFARYSVQVLTYFAEGERPIIGRHIAILPKRNITLKRKTSGTTAVDIECVAAMTYVKVVEPEISHCLRKDNVIFGI